MVPDNAFELRIFEGPQNFTHPGAWSITRVDQVPAGQQARRLDFLERGFFELPTYEIVRFEDAVAGSHVQPVQLEVFTKTRQAEEALQRARFHSADVLESHVV